MPKQQTLKGMEDREISDLKEVALNYVEIRDQRMGLTTQEVELKAKLLALMHKHKKERYVCQGIEITVVHEEESVKVKVHPQKEEKAQNNRRASGRTTIESKSEEHNGKAGIFSSLTTE